MAWTAPRTWVSGELVTAALFNVQLKDNLTILKTVINNSGRLEFAAATDLSIVSGVITVTQNFHTVDTQGDASTDDLVTITAGANVGTGFVLCLAPFNDGRTVVLKNGVSGAANLSLGGDLTMDTIEKTVALIYDGSNWKRLSYL